jgi:hypothetical protein
MTAGPINQSAASRPSSIGALGIVMSAKSVKKKQKTVATLEARDCRWPFGDPREEGFHFCGEPQLPGKPYCALHWQKAFMPARPRGTSAAAPAPVAPLTRRAA